MKLANKTPNSKKRISKIRIKKRDRGFSTKNQQFSPDLKARKNFKFEDERISKICIKRGEARRKGKKKRKETGNMWIDRVGISSGR